MRLQKKNTVNFTLIKNLLILSALFASCTIPRKYQKDKPFVFKNTIEVKGSDLKKEELAALKQRLNAQLDDSSRITTVDKWLFLHYLEKPPAYDSISAWQSAKNMEASMHHLGYYSATASFKADTIKESKQWRTHVQYIVRTGKATLIDTVGYKLRKPELQQLAMNNSKESLLQKNKPITKSAVLGELGRLVDIFRNNGYYKFTTDELKVRGDTSIEALTNISDDPFDVLESLTKAQQQKDSPKIKLAVVLNQPADSTKLEKYYINNIYILPDFAPGDKLTDKTITERVVRNGRFIIRFHQRLFKTNFLIRNTYFVKGDIYRQDDYYKTLSSFSKRGVWQSVNIQVVEVKDSSNKIDLVIQLIPGKKYSFQTALEASYSASSNVNTGNISGNLIGLSTNVSLLNRNLAKESIGMTHTISGGVELNKNKAGTGGTNKLINSNEASYTNSILFPKLIIQLKKSNQKKLLKAESFISTNLSYINRIDFFNMQNIRFAVGTNSSKKAGKQWTFKPLNIEFSKLYNRSYTFDSTLNANPFLRYSFNTSLVFGFLNGGYASSWVDKNNPKKQYSFKWNFEESGLLLSQFDAFKKYLRTFVKTDAEFTYSRSFPKSAFVTKIFAGIGIAAKKDTTLPFFKQYMAGGSNSMRGWPVRGIGLGSQPLAPYLANRFNDRTGDMQLEANIEYRYDIAQIIPNSFILKGALFIDAGNVWNMRNSKTAGTDSAQFKLSNLYRDLGVAAGTGFRLDFNYFVLRFDLGFRFKRPEMAYVNNGWKIPSLSFNDVLPKLFGRGEEYRKWRYENFNFTIGIGYSF